MFPGKKVLVVLKMVLVFQLLLWSGLASAADVVKKGKFTGASDHITTGSVSVVNDGGVFKVVLGGNFTLDGAPDPKVGFGTDGKYDDASDLGVLKSNTGGQEYTVPGDLDVSGYNEVYIWCKKFSVPLGVAKLN